MRLDPRSRPVGHTSRIWPKRWCPGLTALLVVSLFSPGCGFDARWPAIERPTRIADGDVVSYRVDGAKQPNYFQRFRNDQVAEVMFDEDGDGKFDRVVDRHSGDPDWPQCILILDGAPYAIVSAMWQEGHFRLFPPPSRMISVFPAMTDLALTRLLRTRNCTGPEALYFDERTGKLVGGSIAYLRGENAPWLNSVTYHAPQTIGARAYLTPQSVFDEEMRNTLELFRRTRSGTVTAYSIGSAGLGTRGGEPAIRRYLETVEQLCQRIVYEKRGKVHLTLTADHGHNLKPLKRVTFKETLAKSGFRLSSSLRDDRDVVAPAYGLVTCAALYTRKPAAVAAALLHDPAVQLAVYRDGDNIIVLTASEEARVTKRGEGFAYTATRGDPLRLLPIVSKLRAAGKVSEVGEIDDRALFDATVAHDYPDPLYRLWNCFNGLVAYPPSVAISLVDTCCHGSGFFEIAIGHVASTHGSLDRASSTAFVLSDAGPLPPALRIDDFMTLVCKQPARKP